MLACGYVLIAYSIIVQVKLHFISCDYLNWHADSAIAICCKNACVHGLSESEIVTTRDTVWAMNHKQQRKWLLAHFAAIYSHNTRQFTHTVCGKPVCLRAWLFATNISKSKYYEIRGQFLNGYLGDDSPLHTRFIVATEMAMQWLQVYANENGDKLPNAKKVLLPSCMTKSFVYNQYAEEYKGSGYAVSQSTFFKHWETTCQHIIPKVFTFTIAKTRKKKDNHDTFTYYVFLTIYCLHDCYNTMIC